MKLRLRSLESKQTLKVEVPNSCSLNQLKDTISRAISCSSDSVHISLNRKDEIHASSPNDSLQSLGITPGDLLFYTLNSTAFSPQTLIQKPNPQQSHNSAEINTKDIPSNNPTLESVEPEAMDIGDGSGQSNFEPSFTKRMVDKDVNDTQQLIFGVHAVMLESGFIHLDNNMPLEMNRTISLRYTLPDIMSKGLGASQFVLLRFQTLGHFVNVYGSLFDSGSAVHRVCLDKRKHLKLMLTNLESKDSVGDDECDGTEFFELWKIVKDSLALPLSIDLCEKAGLEPPPCFMRLPTELKLMVLEALPAVDIAKVACSCSELRYLSSNNELWKKKFEEEFGPAGSKVKFYKDLFATFWNRQKKRLGQRVPSGNPIRFFPRVRDPNPFGIPSIVGGDYDRQPGFGLPFPSYLPRRIFTTRCLWGGLNI